MGRPSRVGRCGTGPARPVPCYPAAPALSSPTSPSVAAPESVGE